MIRKENLRKKMKKKRNELSKEEKTKKDQSIYEQVIQDEGFINAESVFLFLSFGSEIDTKRIIQYALDERKTVYLPKVVSNHLEIFEIEDFDNLERSSYGIFEPNKNCKSLNSRKIDFILMPGLAFDATGARLGYGAGYYDRFIASLPLYDKIVKVAIAYDFQMIKNVPTTRYDIPVDRIITNKVKNV